MNMPWARLFKHRQTNKCNKAMERQLRQRDVEMVARAAICSSISTRKRGEIWWREWQNLNILGKL